MYGCDAVTDSQQGSEAVRSQSYLFHNIYFVCVYLDVGIIMYLLEKFVTSAAAIFDFTDDEVMPLVNIRRIVSPGISYTQ